MSAPSHVQVAARLRRYAWLVQQYLNAEARARVGPSDRAIAEAHRLRVAAATSVILGTGDDLEERAVTAPSQVARVLPWDAEEGGAA